MCRPQDLDESWGYKAWQGTQASIEELQLAWSDEKIWELSAGDSQELVQGQSKRNIVNGSKPIDLRSIASALRIWSCSLGQSAALKTRSK